MRKKYSQAALCIQILPSKNKHQLIHIEYINPEKILKYKKAVNLSSKKNFKNKPIVFYMSGFVHTVNTKSKINKFKKEIDSGTQFTVKHEYKNKFDNNTCAIFLKKIKIGYIPKNYCTYFIDQATKKKYFKFISCFSPLLIDFDDLTPCSFPIIAISI